MSFQSYGACFAQLIVLKKMNCFLKKESLGAYLFAFHDHARPDGGDDDTGGVLDLEADCRRPQVALGGLVPGLAAKRCIVVLSGGRKWDDWGGVKQLPLRWWTHNPFGLVVRIVYNIPVVVIPVKLCGKKIKILFKFLSYMYVTK